MRSDCRCELCRKYVLSESHISEGSSGGQRASRGFFIYPCEHAFHVSCLYYVVRSVLLLIDCKHFPIDFIVRPPSSKT